ncbi:MAG TPA: ATP-dependent protease ATPase subunit HslU [Candidatus Tripitaka californicus]|uniref:ATP-dependent protease ATPase subunit HslU n=1 Tax=Candidatus Tripitaka californicus TaxID=3367616 RepID=UPI0040252CE7|nr:ATP-dependent protease ATPase subunit HslU [Planctomycetota bacterium]
MKELTPREIVQELDKYIVGQKGAKRAVAIAIRNRWRRLQLPPGLREEVLPKNIIMIGPTGVGKTEIARRLAILVKSPFLKVEASKYTEVGYVGRDVESMIKDLVEISVNMVKQEKIEEIRPNAEKRAEDRLLDLLIPPPPRGRASASGGQRAPTETEEPSTAGEQYLETREKFRKKLQEGKLEDRTVELTLQEKPLIFHGVVAGAEEMGMDFQNILEKMIPPRTQTKKITIGEARRILIQEEAEKAVDRERVIREALDRAENTGIIFIDELDKIASREVAGRGPDVSREGVQRDLLPIVEGTTVVTRYGMVKTDRILFVAAGAFHVSKPSDLIPELQGRFPIRAELESLGREDFIRILREPKNALIKQYTALLETEGVKVNFTEDAIEEIAQIAFQVNQRSQNIGARRLHTVMEKLLEDVSFDAPELGGRATPDGELTVDAKYVRTKLQPILKDEDLSRYIL